MTKLIPYEIVICDDKYPLWLTTIKTLIQEREHYLQ